MTIKKSSFRLLAELTDKHIRQQFEDEKVYYINEARLNNMLWCLESGANRIKELEARIGVLNQELDKALERIEDLKN